MLGRPSLAVVFAFGLAAQVAVSVVACGGGDGASMFVPDAGDPSAEGGFDPTRNDGATVPRDGASLDGTAPPPGPIGEWTDAPGACPAGMPKVDLTTMDQISAATRGDAPYDADAPATCYFIHDGTYSTTGVVMFVKKGGIPGGTHRLFVGQSRSGVVIHGRASTDDGVGDVTIQNLTFDLTGYVQGGSFNTLSLGNGKNLTVDHVTFTGDCATGLKGGHIETNGTDHALVDSCLIEKFGQCSAASNGGHEDHGIYLASGTNIVVRNSVIRGNSSRGIQMYTADGAYGTLDGITVENNRIYENGHADYEDGIVINAGGTGTISNVTIRRNLIYRNRYSGIRFVGGVQDKVVITLSTFDSNGKGSSSAARSEINIDSSGGAASTNITKNVFEVGNALINDCYDGTTKSFGFGGNFVHGTLPTGPKGNCVALQTSGDPQLTDPGTGDYHPKNPAAAAFGAYAP